MKTSSAFFNKIEEDVNIIYRKKKGTKFKIYSHKQTKLNEDIKNHTYDDLKIQVNVLPEKMLKTKDLFFETCDSVTFPKIEIKNNPNRTFSNFKTRNNQTFHQKFIELDYQSQSSKVLDLRKQIIKKENLSPKKKLNQRVLIRDFLDEYIDFIKSPRNNFKETATFIYKNLDNIKKDPQLKISRNTFINKIINNLLRKVIYMTNKNFKISEELALNLIYDEIEELTKSIDKDIETQFKIKNFSSVIKDGDTVTIIPIINSISNKGKYDNLYKSVFKNYENEAQTIKGHKYELSLINEDEKDESIMVSEKVGRNKSKTGNFGITDDPTKLDSDAKFQLTETKSPRNYTDENFRSKRHSHRKSDLVKSRNKSNIKPTNSERRSLANQMLDNMILKGMSVEDVYIPITESPRKSMRDNKRIIEEFNLNRESESNDRYTVLTRSNNKGNKVLKTIKNIELKIDKVLNVEKLDISNELMNKSIIDSLRDSPSDYRKSNYSVLNSPITLEPSQGVKTPDKASPSNNKNRILKSFEKKDTLHKVVNFNLYGNKVKRIGGFKKEDNELSDSLRIINENNKYSKETSRCDISKENNSKNEERSKYNSSKGIVNLSDTKINENSKQTKSSKTTSFNLKNVGNSSQLKSILNKRGNFYSRSSNQPEINDNNSNNITPSNKDSLFSKKTTSQVITDPVSKSNSIIPSRHVSQKSKISKKSKHKKSNESPLDIVNKKETISSGSGKIPMIDEGNHSIIYEQTEGKHKKDTNKTIIDLQKRLANQGDSNKSLFELESSKGSGNIIKRPFRSDKDQVMVKQTTKDLNGNDYTFGPKSLGRNYTNKSSLRMNSKESYMDSSYDENDYLEDVDIKDLIKEDDANISSSQVTSSQERRAIFLLRKRQSIIKLRETLEAFRLKDPSQITEKHIEEFINLTRHPSNNIVNEYNHQQLMLLFEKFKEPEKEAPKVDHKYIILIPELKALSHLIKYLPIITQIVVNLKTQNNSKSLR
jgi:hypothetical protein